MIIVQMIGGLAVNIEDPTEASDIMKSIMDGRDIRWIQLSNGTMIQVSNIAYIKKA